MKPKYRNKFLSKNSVDIILYIKPKTLFNKPIMQQFKEELHFMRKSRHRLAAQY